MPDRPTAPHVFIAEAPSGPPRIEELPTAVTAFVGNALRGPVGEAVRIGSQAAFERIFGGLSRDAPLTYAVRQFFAQGGTDALVVRMHRNAAAAVGSAPGLQLRAASPGSWGNRLRARVEHEPGGGPLFTLAVEDPGTGARERFEQLSARRGDPRDLRAALAADSALVRAAPEAMEELPGANAGAAEAGWSGFAGGADGEPIGDEEVQAGLRRLGLAAPFNLLVLPRLPTAVPGVWTDLAPESRGAAVALCTARGAVFIADPPLGWTSAAEAVAGRPATGLGETPDAALYLPDILAPDPLQPGPPVRFGPSAAVAGVIARTDAARGVWKAPAGTGASLLAAQGLAMRLAEPDIALLNQQGLNTLRDVPQLGLLVWGARTLAGADAFASEWKFLPVRRLGLHIGESLRHGLRWVVFEPNGEPLWAAIRLAAGSFLQGLFRRGAFQGNSAREGYFVRCGAETTTQADLAAGNVDLEVGFAPLKPAEFVILGIRLRAGAG